MHLFHYLLDLTAPADCLTAADGLALEALRATKIGALAVLTLPLLDWSIVLPVWRNISAITTFYLTSAAQALTRGRLEAVGLSLVRCVWVDVPVEYLALEALSLMVVVALLAALWRYLLLKLLLLGKGLLWSNLPIWLLYYLLRLSSLLRALSVR